MRPALLLLALLLPNLAGAAEPHARRELIIRLSELRAPSAPIHQVCIASGVSTILTTPWNIAPRGTGVGERWRASFAVAFGPRRVFLTPRRPLAEGERIPFALRLDDGTAVPLFLAACEGPDGEVAVAVDTDDAAQLRVQLAAARTEAQGLAERLRLALLERDSEDYALAQLVAGGRLDLTGLIHVSERPLETGDRSRIRLITYAPASAPRHGPRKVVAVVTLTNKGTEPVALQVGELFRRSTLEMVPYAARAQPAEIAPGATGRLSVVLDPASLEGDETLTLELRQRAGDRVTGREVDLAAADFGSAWWRL